MDEQKALGFFQDLLTHLEYHFKTTQYDIVTVVALKNAYDLWLDYTCSHLYDWEVRVLNPSPGLHEIDFQVEVKEGSGLYRFRTTSFMLADLGIFPFRIEGLSTPADTLEGAWIEELPHA